jgi:hypothetical protein
MAHYVLLYEYFYRGSFRDENPKKEESMI